MDDDWADERLWSWSTSPGVAYTCAQHYVMLDSSQILNEQDVAYKSKTYKARNDARPLACGTGKDNNCHRMFSVKLNILKDGAKAGAAVSGGGSGKSSMTNYIYMAAGVFVVIAGITTVVNSSSGVKKSKKEPKRTQNQILLAEALRQNSLLMRQETIDPRNV